MNINISISFIGHFEPNYLSKELGAEATAYTRCGEKYSYYKNKEFHGNRDRRPTAFRLSCWRYDLNEVYACKSIYSSLNQFIEIFSEKNKFIQHLTRGQKEFASYSDYYTHLMNNEYDMNDPIAICRIAIDVEGNGNEEILIQSSQLRVVNELCNSIGLLYSCEAPSDVTKIDIDAEVQTQALIECNTNGINKVIKKYYPISRDEEEKYILLVLNESASLINKNAYNDNDTFNLMIHVSCMYNCIVDLSNTMTSDLCTIFNSLKMRYTCMSITHNHSNILESCS